MFKLKDFIHGDKFTEFCDYVIPENDSIIDAGQLSKDCLVFVKTDKIPEFFSIVKEFPFKYVIVSHNSDNNITEEIYNMKPANVLHWFAQNVLVDRPDLTPIPIGVERPGIAGSGDMNVLLEVLQEPVEIKNVAYMNFAWETNPNARQPIIEKYKNCKWVTHEKERIPFRDYLRKIREHLFVFCPPGNGFDTHRLWETLYLRSIPLGENGQMHFNLQTLFDDYQLWPDGEDSLLKMDYWKEKILDTKNDLL